MLSRGWTTPRCFALAAFAAFGRLAPAALAQKGDAKGEVEWRLASPEAYVGEPVRLDLVFTNSQEPETPQLPGVDGLTIELVTPNPSTFNSVQILNGRRTQSTTYTFTFRVTATAPGTHWLPRAAFKAGRKELRPEPVSIHVREAPKLDASSGADYIFLNLSVDRDSVYVSEKVNATLELGVRHLEQDGRPVDDQGALVRYLNNTAVLNIELFGDVQPRSITRKLQDADGNTHLFDVFVFEKTIEAATPGTLTIGPFFFKLDYPLDYSFKRHFARLDYDLSVRRAQTAAVQTAVKTIEVKAPPSESRPPSYRDAIGRYQLDVGASPTKVELGQPITLTLTIQGQPLEGISGPDLALSPELTSRFDFSREEVAGELTRKGKVFRRALFPKQPGVQTLPPIAWSYFDVEKAQYVTLMSDPIEIEVLPGSGETIAPQPSSSDRPDSGITLTRLRDGIAPNHYGPERLLADHALHLGWTTAAAFALPPSLAIVLGFVASRRRRLEENPVLARRAGARARVRARLGAAARLTDPSEQAQQQAEAMKDFIRDRLNLPSGVISPDEMMSALHKARVAEGIVSRIRTFLGSVDAARYGAGADAAGSDASVAEMGAWIREIERRT